ncbi:hypothetical protein BV22DRAFT_1041416 [Leucogyrophana mollusca]|uniref:Uncharacterized protein n=1 Tax=Leucogyrophana mollusca TaxID=85980 RepID=A0ACB8B188_9AGAM|nr:hypothetical protein BV22DRAFT_1041416 [Leucogyrophana mollusca]
MEASRFEAMDAQRFDPLRRIKSISDIALDAPKVTMGQAFCIISNPDVIEPSSPAGSESGGIGGIWTDHEMVILPIGVSSSPPSTITHSSESDTSSSTSTYSSSSYHSSPELSPPSSVEEEPIASPCRQIDVFDRDDLIVTRTIIRPAPSSPITGLFSRPSSPLPTSRPSSPIANLSPRFQALNCFASSAFEEELDFLQASNNAQVQASRVTPVKRNKDSGRPVLQVIVTQTQTRHEYEQDMAFKEDVEELYHRPHNIGRAARAQA